MREEVAAAAVFAVYVLFGWCVCMKNISAKTLAIVKCFKFQIFPYRNIYFINIIYVFYIFI